MRDEFERADLDLYVATHPRPQTNITDTYAYRLGQFIGQARLVLIWSEGLTLPTDLSSALSGLRALVATETAR